MNYKRCFVELKDNGSTRRFKFTTVLSEKEIENIEAGGYAEVFDRLHAEAQILHKQDAYTIIGIFVQCERYIYKI